MQGVKLSLSETELHVYHQDYDLEYLKITHFHARNSRHHLKQPESVLLRQSSGFLTVMHTLSQAR